MSDRDSVQLATLLRMMRDHGVRQLFAKKLAPNDNSKNQPYFGGDFSVLNILPTREPTAALTGTHGKPIFKAGLNFAWLSPDGGLHPAPRAQLILYPQYPEVRFSGYLQGCSEPPSDIVGANRSPGRVLFLGVRDDGQILGYAASAESAAARQLDALGPLEPVGVFGRVPLPGLATGDAARKALLGQLARIAGLGWINSKRLTADGQISNCNSSNCGGLTLEAELGIKPNGYSEPDLLGWEIKQHNVRDFTSYKGGPITLMTPEPTSGFYKTAGVKAFIERYGYQDKTGRPDRMNFGGIHVANTRCRSTGLTLRLLGYDPDQKKIVDPSGGLSLLDQYDYEAATWPYTGLIAHWNRKHAKAVYVPSMKRETPSRQYRFGGEVDLGTGTDFQRFLAAVHEGDVYYDPGIKLESRSAVPKVKRRSQFRIKSSQLRRLYEVFERRPTVDA